MEFNGCCLFLYRAGSSHTPQVSAFHYANIYHMYDLDHFHQILYYGKLAGVLFYICSIQNFPIVLPQSMFLIVSLCDLIIFLKSHSHGN